MSSHTLSLEAENARLKRLLEESEARCKDLEQKNETLSDQVAALVNEVRFLRSEVKRLLAGHRGSGHRIAEGQLTLFGPPVPPAEQPPPSEHVDEAPDGETPHDTIRKQDKPKQTSRTIDTSVLPRERVVHELPEDQRVCPKTGVALVPIGSKIFEEIDYTPAKLSVIEHHRIQYGPTPDVAKERQVTTVTASLPPRALEGCMASAGLIAQLLVMKYRFHLPLYRQEEVFQQAGLRLPRQTLCDWVLKAAFELRPIVVALTRLIRAGPVLQLDDTPVKCQRGKGSKLFQAYLWTFVNPEVEGVVYGFTPGRSAEDLAPLMQGVSADYLVGDGYAGNAAAAREAKLELVHAGCWAHVIRAFRAARPEARSMAGLFENDIRALYEIDAEATELGLDEDGRVDLRRKKARPILARMLRRTRGWKDLFSTRGAMADAVKYLLNSRRTLKTFLLDGRVPLDNNSCERSIRPIAVGRKNWLFAGSRRGGEAAAIVYSLIESCRRAGVDPWEYLRDVLVRVATHPASRVEELIPARWAQLRRATASST